MPVPTKLGISGPKGAPMQYIKVVYGDATISRTPERAASTGLACGRYLGLVASAVIAEVGR